jgi:peptide/nickel transport system substrate-binding protein
VPNSPSSYVAFVRPITETIVVDPYTIRFKTAAPYPLLPNDMANVSIVSRKFEQAPTGDFNNGRAAIGTGSYRFAEFVPGDRIVLQRFDGHWGIRGHWAKVTHKIITNDAARVAALLAGDVQIIENVPTPDLARVRQNANLSLSQTLSNRLIYLHVDSFRDQSPFVTDKAGAVLPNNPLKDRRVRQALSKAINRPAIVERVMDGAAIPAGDIIPEGMFGSNPRNKAETFDPEGARKLLADAGYPNGFGMSIHGPNDRYLNDEKILQAVGPMFTRIGIDTKVVTSPWATFSSQSSAPNYAFSLVLVGWGAGTGEAAGNLRALLASVDRDRGMGASNRGRFSNPQLDTILREALATVDDEKREKLLQDASEIAMREVGLIPLHYQVNIWGMRRGLAYTARTDEYTLAQYIRPAN